MLGTRQCRSTRKSTKAEVLLSTKKKKTILDHTRNSTHVPIGSVFRRPVNTAQCTLWRTAAAIPASHDGLHYHKREGMLISPRRSLERQRKVRLRLFRVDHSLIPAGENGRVGLISKQRAGRAQRGGWKRGLLKSNNVQLTSPAGGPTSGREEFPATKCAHHEERKT